MVATDGTPTSEHQLALVETPRHEVFKTFSIRELGSHNFLCHLVPGNRLGAELCRHIVKQPDEFVLR
jgi:hypothetical protein